MELNAAKMLHDLNIGYDVPDIELQQRLSRIEAQSDIVLDTHQREAVAEAVKNGLLVITGGPGTGKPPRSPRSSGISNRRTWRYCWLRPRAERQSA